MKISDRFIGRAVTDLMGQRMGMVTGVHEDYSNMLKVVYWDRKESEYVTDYWEIAAVQRVPFYDLELEKEPNVKDLDYEVTRSLAFADAALVIHDKELFEEAFAIYKPARQKIPEKE